MRIGLVSEKSHSGQCSVRSGSGRQGILSAKHGLIGSASRCRWGWSFLGPAGWGQAKCSGPRACSPCRIP